MTVARRPREAENDNIGPVFTNYPHNVAENAVVTPFLQSFCGGFGKTKIDRPCKKLLRAVNLPGIQQLLGADDAQLGALLGADQVLAALAARQRKVRCAHMAAAGEIG